MQAESLSEEAEELCQFIQQKLQNWQRLGEAPEYYALRNRGPYKPTVVHELNRFGGQMGPYVDAQLKLETVPYINASPIDNLGEGVPHFVATMCPKKQTFAHFWSMVWEVGCTMIINLTHERDKVGSEPTDKRERYWPPFDEATTRHARRWPVQVRTLGCEVCAQVPGLARYAIELRGPAPSRERRVVRLYWYSRWVDFPSSASIGSKPFFSNAWSVLHMALCSRRSRDVPPCERHCCLALAARGGLSAPLAAPRTRDEPPRRSGPSGRGRGRDSSRDSGRDRGRDSRRDSGRDSGREAALAAVWRGP